MGELQGLPQTATWALKEELERRGFYVSDTVKGQDYYLKENIREQKEIIKKMAKMMFHPGLIVDFYHVPFGYNDWYELIDHPAIRELIKEECWLDTT